MRRVLVLLLLAGGCDRVLQLGHLDPPADAAPDAPPDAAPDAPAFNYLGCSDRSREGFADPTVYPAIAACAGAWSVPGVRDMVPACNHQSGNDGVLLAGVGCSAADLCSVGWHVCKSSIDVAQSLPVSNRTCSGLGAGASMFFATGQGGPGGDCAPINNLNDDIAGCGTYGLAAMANCAPLERTTSNACGAFNGIGGWNCPPSQNGDEVHYVTKTEPLIGGGVLCCRDL